MSDAPETKNDPSPPAPAKRSMTLAQSLNGLVGLALLIFWIMLIVRTSAMGKSRYTCTPNRMFGHKQTTLYTWGIVLCVLVVFLPSILNGAGMRYRSSDDDKVGSRYDWSSVMLNGLLLAVVIFMWSKIGAHTPQPPKSDMLSFYSY